jgi:hypothetical protein
MLRIAPEGFGGLGQAPQGLQDKADGEPGHYRQDAGQNQQIGDERCAMGRMGGWRLAGFFDQDPLAVRE